MIQYTQKSFLICQKDYMYDLPLYLRLSRWMEPSVFVYVDLGFMWMVLRLEGLLDYSGRNLECILVVETFEKNCRGFR